MFKVKILAGGILALLLGAGLTRVTYSMLQGAPINVIDKGADPTAGVDSQPGIQRAVTAACAGSKAVYIPAGTYLVGSTITACSNITIRGEGALSILRPTISDLSAVINFPASSTQFKLADFAIISAVNTTNFAAGTATAQQCTGVKVSANGTRYSLDNVRVTGVKVGFDMTGWIHTQTNVWANYNEIGFKCTTCNAVDLNLRLEANNQHFVISNSGGVYFRNLLAEGNNATTVASTVDGGQAVTFDGMYLENAVSPNPTQPFLVIGGTTLVQNVVIHNATVYNGGAANGVDAIKIDQADNVIISGQFASGAQRRNIQTTTNTTNVRYEFSVSFGSWHRDNSNGVAPAFNYWPNRRFDLWERGWAIGPQTANRATPSLETTIVRNGANALRLTAQAGQNQNHSHITIQGPVVTALRGKTMRLGVWMWVPNLAVYSTESAPTMPPAVYLSSYNGSVVTTSPNLNGFTAVSTWNFITATLAIQSDATEIRADLWPNNGNTNGTGAEYVVVSSITLTEATTPLYRQLNDDLIDSPLIPSIGLGGKMVASGTAAPTDTLQTYAVGDVVLNSAPATGSVLGWICTVAGSPGTWVPMGTVGAGTSGATLVSVLQAALGTPANGTVYYCSDCNTATACTAGGTGAFASRQNGAWKCL